MTNEERMLYATDPNTEPAILEKIAAETLFSGDWWIGEAIAKNPNTSPGTLAILSYNKYDYARLIRKAVADNRKTPKDIIQSLMNDNFIVVREAAMERYKKITHKNFAL